METADNMETQMNVALFDLMNSKTARPGTVGDIWMTWLYTNRRRLREAILELGLMPPPPGDNLIGRIRDLVQPKLILDETVRRANANQTGSVQ